MAAGLLITAIAGFLFWLVFFKFKWIRLTYGWGLFVFFFVLHISLIFVVGLRFVTPYTTNAKVIQHTIQLVPRLPEPTLVTAVLVEPDVPVKKDQPLFQFDRRPYEYKVRQLEAQLAQAQQNVKVMKADTEATAQKVVKLQSELSYSAYQQKLSAGLSRQGAGPEEDAQKWTAKVAADKAAVKEAEAELLRAQLNYTSRIDGVNTKVAAIQAELDQARYYLDNTLMVAPEDGCIVNLQVRSGMVSGIVRFGAIASFICEEGRYLLADFFKENLKYVKPGQPVEVALNLYPGLDLHREGRGRLDSQRRWADAPERHTAGLRTGAAGSAAGPIRGEDFVRQHGAVEVPDRRARRGGDLHRWHERQLGRVAPHQHPHLHMVQLAVSHAFLRQKGGGAACRQVSSRIDPVGCQPVGRVPEKNHL
ncbi:MAG: biotin/lipoyl-binding protein [Desulfobacterales bacterium]